MAEATINLTFEDCKNSCFDTDSFSVLNNQSILVTGGTGFMGKWIAEMISFINEMSEINVILYLLGRDINKFKMEVPHLASKSFIKFIEQDVRNIRDLPVDINYIVNAAGSPDNRDHVSQPLRTIETFFKGTQSLFDAATRLPNLKRIIHISSHTVYGRNDSVDLIDEKFSGRLETNNISQVYAEGKRGAETLCAIYRSSFKLPLLILRPFAFIGPYQKLEKPWAINNFIRDGILGGPIRILGNGSIIRSYLYGSDMAYWILKALLNGQVGESYNLGSMNGISLDGLAVKVKECIAGNNIEILSKSSRSNYSDFSTLVPDNSKIIKALQVKETYSIDEAIKRTIVWNQLNKK